ncbi:hypothetical protein [Pannonibacter phragmitetus]
MPDLPVGAQARILPILACIMAARPGVCSGIKGEGAGIGARRERMRGW